MTTAAEQPNPEAPAMRSRWKIFFALVTLAALASLASVPLEIAALSQVQSDVPWWASVVAFAFGFVPSVIGVAMGIAMLPATDIDLTIIKRLTDRQPSSRSTIRSILIRSVVFAVIGFVVVRLFSVYFEPILAPELAGAARDKGTDLPSFSSSQYVLLSFAAGVREELVFRFGLMTLFIWMGIKLFAVPKVSSPLIWMANLFAAIPFALAHSINALGLGIPITSGLIALLVLSNGSVGLLFGWLYARFGLAAAMIAHTFYDIIQFVIWPILAESTT